MTYEPDHVRKHKRLEEVIEYLVQHVGQDVIDQAPTVVQAALQLGVARARARKAAEELAAAERELKKLEHEVVHGLPYLEFPLVSEWLDEVGVTARTRSILTKQFAGKTLLDLIARTDGQLLEMKYFGRRSLNELKEILSFRGLRLDMTEEDARKSYRPPPL